VAYASGRVVVVVVAAAIALQVDASQKLSCIHEQANGAAPCALKIDPIRDVRDISALNIYRIRMTNVGKPHRAEP
jgi:hypothetical protein